ncbi:MAG: response regulator [Oscillospiraceae bacterium]|nr:response regulator [Oscillospiraceae bacterium]
MRNIIFVVDDNATNLTVAEEALDQHYRVIALSSAAKMFKALDKFTPDLILLDIDMPEMNGFETLKRLKASHSHSDIPVIFLTALTDAANETYGLELGAVDFIMKPFSEPVLLNRIQTHLHIDKQIRESTAQLRERTRQLVQLQNSIVYTLADLVENRDHYTAGHIERTTKFIEILIGAMRARNVYADELSGWDIESVISSARLHDVGKIVIPDAILNKPGPLTGEEFDIMKTHSAEGARIIAQTIRRTGDTEFLQNAALIAAYHHERWDGSGYPHGLAGPAIPLHGRVMAVIDVYDALISERSYKKAFSHDEAVRIITEEAGRHFDPAVAGAFVSVSDRIGAAT